MSVVQLSDHRPHLSGEAICIDCGFKWIAVAPVGTDWLECPECGLMRSRMKYPVIRGDTAHWTCKCGNDLFYITPDFTYCPNCGGVQRIG